MKKLGLLILSLMAIAGGVLIVMKDKIFGEVHETSEENLATATVSTATTTASPNIVYVTQSVSGTAVIGSLRVINAGIIPSGKIFFKIANVGAANGTVNVGTGVRILKPTEFIVYNESLNPTVKPSGQIVYDATSTEFIIDTVDA